MIIVNHLLNNESEEFKMSCPNFMSMKYGMPMVCGKTYSQFAEEYEKEFGEEMPDSEYYWEKEYELEFAYELAKEFSQQLIYHEVEIKSGYYDSFQFYVEEKYNNIFDLDKDSEYCIDNEDAHYYFDTCKSIALRKADAEKRKIKKWLYTLKETGFNLVYCKGIFSNGEAVYEIL